MTQALPAAGGWAVESQTESLQLNAQGAPVDVVIIGYVTGSGVHGTVTMTREQYRNIDLVRQVVSDAAAHTDAVANLSA